MLSQVFHWDRFVEQSRTKEKFQKTCFRCLERCAVVWWLSYSAVSREVGVRSQHLLRDFCFTCAPYRTQGYEWSDSLRWWKLYSSPITWTAIWLRRLLSHRDILSPSGRSIWCYTYNPIALISLKETQRNVGLHSRPVARILFWPGQNGLEKRRREVHSQLGGLWERRRHFRALEIKLGFFLQYFFVIIYSQKSSNIWK